MKIENNKVEKLVFGIFLGFGILFFLLGILLGTVLGGQNKEDYTPVTATISDIVRYNDSHSVYIDYEFEGEQYTGIRYNVYKSSMRVGKQIDVMVNKYNPTSFYIGNLGPIFLLSFSGFGLVFGLIGGIPLIIFNKKAKHMKKLMSTGQAVWGTVEEVCVNRNVTVNGRHPKYFVVKYEDDGIITATSHFKSGSFFLPGDGSELIGRNIKIYLNPQDRKDYAVDLTSIQIEDQYYGF